MTKQEVTCRKMGNKGGEGGPRFGKGRRKRRCKNVWKETGKQEKATVENSALVWESK